MYKFGLNAAAVILLTVLTPAASQAGIQIGGGSISLGGGSINLACAGVTIGSNGSLEAQQGQLVEIGSLLNSGTLEAGQSQLSLSGNWTNSGVFSPGQSLVRVTDDCGNTTAISGANTFWRLQADGLGQQLVFGAGDTQQVLNNLVLRGNGATDRLVIRSSAPGQPAFIDLAIDAAQTIFWVDVADNHASAAGQPLAIGFPEAFESVDSGGNRNWFTDGLLPILPVPVLSPLMLALLALLLLTAGILQQYRRSANRSSDTRILP